MSKFLERKPDENRHGELSEWSKVQHSKSVCAKAHKGSNPFLSATKSTVIYYGGLFLCHKMLNNKNFRLFRYIVPPLWNYSAAKMVRFTEHELIQATQTM